MRIETEVKLDYNDVLIRPKRSEAASRKTVKLIRKFKFPHSQLAFTCVPIMASNMYATGTIQMAKALYDYPAPVCLHKFYDIHKLVNFYATHRSDFAFYTLGIKDEDFEKLSNFRFEGFAPQLLCLDVANGYTKYFVEKVIKLREELPDSIIMVGNVATPEMVQELILAGADIVKIGIGPGSHCTTRLVAGVGYPQLSAVIECADAAHGLNGLICADGGCTTSADVAKAFGGGADFVMLGGMLAGTKECAGEWTASIPPELKVYGMSSQEAQEKHYGGVKDYCTSEGLCSTIPAKGPVKDILGNILGGLRSTCAYVGAGSLKDLSKCTTFVRVNRIH